MQRLKELIERNSETYPEFLYYIVIAEKAERNELEHPDIAIECCNSLFQGISKTIILRLDPTTKNSDFDRADTEQCLKPALRLLRANADVIEDDFVRRGVSIALAISTLRNARGDISHGRAVPKELQSDRSLSHLVLTVSEALLRYMLATFYSILPEGDPTVEFDENPGFNDQLDADNPLDGKVSFSRALYDQYYEDYVLRLKDWIDEMQELAQ